MLDFDEVTNLTVNCLRNSLFSLLGLMLGNPKCRKAKYVQAYGNNSLHIYGTYSWKKRGQEVEKKK